MRFISNGPASTCHPAVSKLALIGQLVVLVMVAVAGCEGSGPDAPVGPSVPTEVLSRSSKTGPTFEPSAPVPGSLRAEGVWTLDSLDGRPPVEGSIVTLRVDENSMGGIDGCNRYGGGSEVGSGFGPDGVYSLSNFGGTLILCRKPEGVMEQTDAYQLALLAGKRYGVVDDRLEIYDSVGTARLVFVRQAPLQGRPVALSGTSWRLLGKGEEGRTTITFLDHRLATGTTACRSYFATYNTSGETIRFPSKGMRRAHEPCTEASKRLEGEYTDFLSWAWEYSVYADEGSRRLELRSSRGKTLNFKPVPPAVQDIADAEWTLRVVVEVREGLAFRDRDVVEGTEVTMLFDESGISGTSGCNPYSGLATVEDGSITVDDKLLRAERACEGPDGVMEQERLYLDLLPQVTRYSIFGDELFLQAGDVFLLFQTK